VFPKTLGQPREVKNVLIMLKIDTFVAWMNAWGCFFYFLKIFLFGPLEPVFL